MHPFAHCSIIPSGQDTGGNKVSSGEGLGEAAVGTHPAEQLSATSRGKHRHCDNMGITMLSQTRPSEKAKSPMISLTCGI